MQGAIDGCVDLPLTKLPGQAGSSKAPLFVHLCSGEVREIDCALAIRLDCGRMEIISTGYHHTTPFWRRDVFFCCRGGTDMPAPA